jgi:uncharacterized damage-inducible protein DinB
MKGQRRRSEVEGLVSMYAWVVQTRAVLHGFLAKVPWDTLSREVSTLHHGSVRNLLTHTVSVYRWWLDCCVKGLEMPQVEGSQYASLADLQAEFAGVDRMVRKFLRDHDGSIDTLRRYPVPWEEKPFAATPRWLFTQAVTHEFHHKGQITTITRQLGYQPVDTDLVAPRRWT